MMVAAAIFMVVAVSLAAGSPDRHQKWWKWPSSGSDGASSSSSSSPVYSRGGPSSIVLPLYGNKWWKWPFSGSDGASSSSSSPSPVYSRGGPSSIVLPLYGNVYPNGYAILAFKAPRLSLVIVVVPIPGVQPGWAVFDCSAAVRQRLSKRVPDSSLQGPTSGPIGPRIFYFAQVDIGNPPRPYFVDPDTGSDLTWLQCDAPCVHCTRAPHPYYKPNNDLVICKDPLCASLHLGDYTCEDPQQCDYEVEYADGGSSLGVLLNDVFHLNLTNGVKINPHLALGCGYDQVPGTSHHPLDGILGLGRGKSSVVTQLWGQGLVRNVIGHCLSGRGGGYLFLGDEVYDASRITWTPMSRDFTKHYSPGPAELTFGGKSTGAKNMVVVFDSGSSYSYFISQPYEVFLYSVVKELRGKPLREARDDPTLPFCWKGRKPFRSISDVKKYFKPFALSFANGWRSRTLFDISPESYLIISWKEDVWERIEVFVEWVVGGEGCHEIVKLKIEVIPA
nr:aspartic proteinase Asp1 [Ipomoea batatas]